MHCCGTSSSAVSNYLLARLAERQSSPEGCPRLEEGGRSAAVNARRGGGQRLRHGGRHLYRVASPDYLFLLQKCPTPFGTRV